MDIAVKPNALAFLLSTRTRSLRVLRSRLRGGESHPTPSLVGVRTSRSSLIAVNVAEFLDKLLVIADVEVVVALLPECGWHRRSIAATRPTSTT